jgi:putative endonuclease
MKKPRKLKKENAVVNAASTPSPAITEVSESGADQSPTVTPQKPWYLYLIECQDGTYYAGITTNVAKRYQTHVSGKGAKYTRARKPRRLLGARVYINRSEAAKAEWAIKQLDKREKLGFLRALSDETGAPSTILVELNYL